MTVTYWGHLKPGMPSEFWQPIGPLATSPCGPTAPHNEIPFVIVFGNSSSILFLSAVGLIISKLLRPVLPLV